MLPIEKVTGTLTFGPLDGMIVRAPVSVCAVSPAGSAVTVMVTGAINGPTLDAPFTFSQGKIEFTKNDGEPAPLTASDWLTADPPACAEKDSDAGLGVTVCAFSAPAASRTKLKKMLSFFKREPPTGG